MRIQQNCPLQYKVHPGQESDGTDIIFAMIVSRNGEEKVVANNEW